MANPTKNDCPICGSPIILREYEFHGVSSNSSVVLGGVSSQIFYRCEANFDVCSVSVSIFDLVMERTKQYDKMSKNGGSWRDALTRRNHYDLFIEDHPHIKDRLLAIADDELYIKGSWEYLIPTTE
ncbi:hypothetical protein OTK49_03025 [Vibrio coralliirubri]|uniref:hypothetical protein n=1 Tax=Vibrio coralliirubri TaxID=1516159 RepID=UPI0022835BF2|nr:hypothetical protein [Vibrio coralliirubri]MCY9861488.1 hypothetical protein [Vibrio coralliirubri]